MKSVQSISIYKKKEKKKKEGNGIKLSDVS